MVIVVTKNNRRRSCTKTIVDSSALTAADASGVLPPLPRAGIMDVDIDLMRSKRHKPSLGWTGNVQTPLSFVSLVSPRARSNLLRTQRLPPKLIKFLGAGFEPLKGIVS